MPTTTGTTATSRRKEDGRHHAAPRERIDVDGIPTFDRRAMGRQDFFHHARVAGQPMRKRRLDVIRPQRGKAFGHVGQPTDAAPDA